MINKVILIGNVGQEPETKTTSSGVKVATVSLATTEKIYNSDKKESKEHTEWHSVVLWRGLADIAEKYVSKGSQIYIEGKIRAQEWTDANGNKRIKTSIVADALKLLGRKPEASNSQATAASAPAQEIDNLPF